MGMESKFVWMNGEMVPFEKATIHFLTPALHYGAAVFEGIRAYATDKGPAIFRLYDHTDRLFRSAHILRMAHYSQLIARRLGLVGHGGRAAQEPRAGTGGSALHAPPLRPRADRS